MKKETLEEVAERFWRNDETMSDYVQQAYITGFIAGSKWQQEQDREMEKERIIDAYTTGLIYPLIMKNYKGLSVDEIRIELKKQAAEYYNETYKNETK